ncbi:hypothetical protein Tco_0487695 [Tanacetum coccineum]
MTTTVDPRSRIDITKDETVIFEANLENSSICTPKRLKWDEITRNQTWNLEELVKIKPLKLNKDIANIVEISDGNIEISFGNKIGESSRHSTSTYVPSNFINEEEKLYLKRAQSLRMKGVDFNTSIPKPLYEEDNKRQQLNRIENSEASSSQNNQTSILQNNQASTSQSNQIDIEDNPMFIPYNINKPIKLGRQDHHILQEIEEKLSKLHISNINEEISSEDDISDIEQQFREDDLDIEKQENEINRLKFKNTYTPRPEARNYYNRPTPPDMQYEESPVRQRALFDGLSIYEWNLDGQTEHQIMNILQEMTMASNAYKTHKNTETQIVEILIAGFTGCLKGWWDNYVAEAEKAIVFKAKKTIVKNENGVQVQTQEDDMIMINEESDISDYEEEDLNISKDESSSENESEICDCIGNWMNPDKKTTVLPRLPSPSLNRFTPLTPYPPTPNTSPITRPTYSVLAKLQGLPPSPNPYNRSPTTASSSTNKTEFYINPNTQVVKILEPIEEQKLNQGFTKEAEGTSPPLLIRKFSVKWWKQVNDHQADKEAVIKYYKSLIQETPKETPSTSNTKTKSVSKLSKSNSELAKKILDCDDDEEFARIMNYIKRSPTPSEDLFQDS